MENKIKALAKHLDCKKSEIEQCKYANNMFEHNTEEYLIVTNDEANELWEEFLDSYLKECVYPELPDHLVRYFDDNAWKSDARFDGRGHSLNLYDGTEYEETVKGETYYIYRQN